MLEAWSWPVDHFTKTVRSRSTDEAHVTSYDALLRGLPTFIWFNHHTYNSPLQRGFPNSHNRTHLEDPTWHLSAAALRSTLSRRTCHFFYTSSSVRLRCLVFNGQASQSVVPSFLPEPPEASHPGTLVVVDRVRVIGNAA